MTMSSATAPGRCLRWRIYPLPWLQPKLHLRLLRLTLHLQHLGRLVESPLLNLLQGLGGKRAVPTPTLPFF